MDVTQNTVFSIAQLYIFVMCSATLCFTTKLYVISNNIKIYFYSALFVLHHKTVVQKKKDLLA